MILSGLLSCVFADGVLVYFLRGKHFLFTFGGENRYMLITMIKNVFLFFAVSLGFIFLQGCDNEDVTKEVKKDGSIESSLSVVHLNDTQDVLTTTHKIWVAGKISKVTVHKDTIPSLGLVKTEVENNEGDKLTVPVKKDYEFYITVK